MIQNINQQEKEILVHFSKDTQKVKHAFTLFNSAQTEPRSEEKRSCIDNISYFPKGNRQLSSSTCPKHTNSDGQVWQPEQIGRLFNLYDFYGPQWKIMSEQMPNRQIILLFRSANNLKNRFYTVLRNLIKLLFKKSSDNCPKLSGEIPSKDLSRLYDGKQDYEQLTGFISNLLKEIDFDLQSLKMESIVGKYCTEIIQIYHTIYGERATIAIKQSKQKQQKVDAYDGMLFPTSSSFQRADEFEKINNSTGNQFFRKIPFEFQGQPKQEMIYFYFLQPSNIYLQGV